MHIKQHCMLNSIDMCILPQSCWKSPERAWKVPIGPPIYLSISLTFLAKLLIICLHIVENSYPWPWKRFKGKNTYFTIVPLCKLPRNVWYTFYSLSWNMKILDFNFQNFPVCERLFYWKNYKWKCNLNNSK